ncbi:MAG TPA: DNA translocase FtsK 4TM domain-containing protein, partial [Rhabdochlamydiaceae bacterium]
MAKKESSPKNTHPEAKGLLFLLLSIVSLVCLFSYDIDDKSTNWMGMIGHGYAWTLMYLFGLTVYIVLGFVGWIGWKLLLQGEIPRLKS